MFGPDNAVEGFCETTYWNVIVQQVKWQILHAGLAPCVSSWRGGRRGLGVRGRVVACLPVPVTGLPRPRPAGRGPVQAAVHPKCNLMTSSRTGRESQAYPAICPSVDKAPRLSIRRVIWILASDTDTDTDTVFVQLNQYSQILRRQCCLPE